MGRFITAKSRIEQTENGYWKTLDNELYLDDDGTLTITPRLFWSDGYTFPGILTVFLGDKHYWDVRAAHGHDLFCRFHERMKVNMSISLLKMKGYLRTHYDNKGNPMVICEDIPLEYIDVQKVTKRWTDDCFKRMMLACDIPRSKANIIRFGVTFNFNWYLKTGKKSILTFDIYKEDIGLVNGL